MGSKVAAFFLMLLLIPIVLFSYPQIAQAATNIFYIQPDGMITPATHLLRRDFDTYKMTGDISGSIIVRRDNIRIEGNGYSLQGAGNGSGIDLSSRYNVEVADVRISFFHEGISLNGSYSSVLENNEISYNDVGIRLGDAKDNYVIGNAVFYNVFGMQLENSNGNTIVYNKVIKNFYGIAANSSNNNMISHNDASSNYVLGMNLNLARSNIISNNNVSNNEEGISLAFSQGNILDGNVANLNNIYGLSLSFSQGNRLSLNKANANKEYGITIFNSSNNILTGNAAANNAYNFRLEGSQPPHFDNNIDISNTVNGKAILYAKNVTGKIFDATTNAGTVYIINGTYVTLKDLVLENNEYGLFLWNTRHTRITNITTYNNRCGILLQESENNLIALSRIIENNEGAKLENSWSNILSNNEILSNKGWGIQLKSSSVNTFLSNRISYNNKGILLYRCTNTLLTTNEVSNDFYGIVFTNTSLSTLSSNEIYSNGWHGISLKYSSQNRITENNITKSLVGITLEQSTSNAIFHNNFINNTKEAEPGLISANQWDDGYPSGGNYWSDQTKTDIYTGAFQNNTGSDGIADLPYTIGESIRDRYPLMNPWHRQLQPTVLKIVPAVSNVSLIREVFNVSIWMTNLDAYWRLSYVEFKLKYKSDVLTAIGADDGAFTKRFADQYPPSPLENPNSTTYSFLCQIEPSSIQIVSCINHPAAGLRYYPEGDGMLATITFRADSRIQAEGAFELVETEIYGELDRKNQIPHYAEAGYFRILIGDYNKDGKVDITDIGNTAKSFGSYPNHPRWNAQADINQDGKVDIKDIALVASNFGRSWGQ